MDETQRRLAEELIFTEKKKYGFAKQLFFGTFDNPSIFPFPAPNREERERSNAFEEKVEAFACERIDAAAIDQQADIPPAVLQGLAQLGVFGMTIPTDFGGLGMSQYAYCRVTELLARRCCSTALLVNAHQSIGLKALLLFGTEEQKKQWLPPLARGEHLAAFSLTEPNAGSDASGIETRATWDEEKKVWRLNGRKQWTTNGSIAQVLTVMAKTTIATARGMEDKVTAFLVTPDMPGFSITAAALNKVGMRGTHTSNIALDNVAVPESHILGPLGAGLRVCLTVLDYGRTTFGALCTGVAKALVAEAFAHAITRHQFQRPLASFALVKKKLATMSALAYAMESTTYLTAGFIDNGTEDIMLEAAILKIFTSEALWYIIYETMQIFGGRSFFNDLPYERAMRDARLNMIGEGANEVLRAFVGLVGMREIGLELKGLRDGWRSWPPPLCISASFFWNKLFLSPFGATAAPLQNPSHALSKALRRFFLSLVKLLGCYGEGIIEKQLALDRIATSAIALYTSSAVLSRLEGNLDGNKRCEKELVAGLHFCHIALHDLDTALSGIFSPLDTASEKAADALLSLYKADMGGHG